MNEIVLKSHKTVVFGSVLAICIGDALGVPVEFMTRESLSKNPVVGYRGYGNHNQPLGTWSDDSSLTLCTIDALIQADIDWRKPLDDEACEVLCGCIANNFAKWYREGFWTANGLVFDIGITTHNAIIKIQKGLKTWHYTDYDERNNGNGSLMRILPLAFLLENQDITFRFDIIKKVSCITHRHIRSAIACHIYIEYAMLLIRNTPKDALIKMQNLMLNFYVDCEFKDELSHFSRILYGDISSINENEIISDGYVVHTLEAALYCFLTTSSIKEALLKAVNLGLDTDTVAAVSDGLAGLYYGLSDIKEDDIFPLAKAYDIQCLIEGFYDTLEVNKLISNVSKL